MGAGVGRGGGFWRTLPAVANTTFTLLLTSVIREPLVEFPLEVGAIELGALLFTEVLGPLGTVLSGTMGGTKLNLLSADTVKA